VNEGGTGQRKGEGESIKCVRKRLSPAARGNRKKGVSSQRSPQRKRIKGNIKSKTEKKKSEHKKRPYQKWEEIFLAEKEASNLLIYERSGKKGKILSHAVTL